VLGDLSGFLSPSITSGVFIAASNAQSCSFTHISGAVKNALHPEPILVDIYVGKYMPKRLEKRGIMIEYDHHKVLCDFDTKHLCVVPSEVSCRKHDFQRLDILVKRSYAARNYAVQASLIQIFFEHGWRGLRFDDFDGQRQVLRWLVDHRSAIAESQGRMFTYDGEGAGLPDSLTDIVAIYQASRP
jgi:hypothetical protein